MNRKYISLPFYRYRRAHGTRDAVIEMAKETVGKKETVENRQESHSEIT